MACYQSELIAPGSSDHCRTCPFSKQARTGCARSREYNPGADTAPESGDGALSAPAPSTSVTSTRLQAAGRSAGGSATRRRCTAARSLPAMKAVIAACGCTCPATGDAVTRNSRLAEPASAPRACTSTHRTLFRNSSESAACTQANRGDELPRWFIVYTLES